VNDSGEVVGTATNQNEALRAFVWKAGVMTDLGALEGDDCSIAKAVNARGQIVGTSFPCATGSENAALWDNGSVISLNSFVPPGSDLHLTGDDMYINDRGEIAGTAKRPNGDQRAFLLIPCGETTEDCRGATEGATAATQSAASHTAPQRQLTRKEISRIRAVLMNRHRGFMPRTIH
jgi:probable HAF family extracellular repeat protein